MMKFLSKLFLILISAAVVSCTKNAPRGYLADDLAHTQGFTKKYVKGGQFLFTSYQRITSPNLPFTVYIEGDGRIMKSRYSISQNPTPLKPMVLKLATMDKRPNVVYLARPCQYTPMNLNQACNETYWLDKRMSEDSVHALNQAINNITNGEQIDLVGFSGGGGIAVLVAARNPQVRSITTFAGNLDHIEFSKYKRVERPMIGSLNPIDYAKKINHIPQLHLSGTKDKVVPAFIADKFIAASGSTRCIQHEIIDKTSHNEGWDKVWNYILSIPVKCKS